MLLAISNQSSGMEESHTAALAANAPLAQAVLETIGNLVLVMDRHGCVVFCNEAVEKLSGYQRQELRNRPVWELFYLPVDRDRIAAAYQRILDGGFPASGEHYWLTRDGRQRLVFWRYTALTGPQGQVEYVVGAGDDVTEQRESERSRADSLNLMKAVMDSSQDAVLVLDHQGRLVEWNPAAERMFGHPRAEVLGRRMSEVIIPERLRGSYRAGLAVLQEGGTLFAVGKRQETVAVRRDGSEFPIELALSTWGSGEQLRILAGVRDLSERLDADSARRANEAKTRFLAIVSHEFRTPLNSILGFAQLLGEGDQPLSERHLRYVEYILSSGSHLLDLVNDLLDLTKVQIGQMDLHLEDVDLARALEDAGAKVKPLASAADLTLTVDAGSGLGVRGDRRRLDQVMLNLLANAIKFTPAGGTVDVRCGRAGDRVEISVADTGIGIPLSQQESIFEEFTQVDSEANREQTGTGLGLALAQQLVSAMGGSVRVASVVGQGSTFTVSLPSA
jgi:PAS domain S-box-containing protein